ncbi:MAG: hypothetical protein U0229_11655 [Anaeromyxobacter sp.]
MAKLTVLAGVALLAVACASPFNDPPAGAPAVIAATITGRDASGLLCGFLECGIRSGPWSGQLEDGTWTGFVDADGVGPTPSPTASTYGRFLVLTPNVLLDGSSVEAAPQTCVPAAGAGWTFSGPAELPAGGAWYTCYYPSSANGGGASVFVYYAVVPPGPGAAAMPGRAGRMVLGDYAVSGTVRAEDGTPLELRAAWKVVLP